MSIETYFVKPKEGNFWLHVCRVTPDVPPRFVLQIVHGIAERVERYLPLMRFFAANGGIVLAHDLRGHGHSVPNARLLGHCGDLYRTFRDDLDTVYATDDVFPENGCAVPKKIETYDVPALPRYLLGFSMGALIAGLYAAESSENLAGLILTGLPHREPFVSAAILGLDALTLFTGDAAKPMWFHKRTFTRYNRGFTPEEGSDGQFLWLSNDLENRRNFTADPLCNRPNSLGTYTTLLKFLRDLYRPASWNMDRRDLPIFVNCGELDPVAGGKKGTEDSVKFLADMGYTDVRSKVSEGFRHEIYFDTGHEVPFADVLGFIEGTISAENDRLAAKRGEYENQFT